MAELPESIIIELLTNAKPPKKVNFTPPVNLDLIVRIYLDWCQRSGIRVLNVRPGDGCIFIDLVECVSKGRPSEDGNPAIIIYDSGFAIYSCFHTHCEGVTLHDLEELYGPIYPQILVTSDTSKAVSQSIAALARTLYQRGGVLVEPITPPEKPPLSQSDNGATRFVLVPPAKLHSILTAVAKYKKYNAKGEIKSITPPDNLVKAIHASSTYPGIQEVYGIRHAPILHCDGNIVTKPGYDADTGVYLDIQGEYPGIMSLEKAIELFNNLVIDFPFATLADKSVALAALITLAAKDAFPGPAPFFLFDGNVSRVGKGLLTDLFMILVEGLLASRSNFTEGNELRKLITSVLMSGSPYILFDNIKDKFGGAVIENAMTANRWSDRALGGNRVVDLAMNLIWMATSNNATVSSYIVGRTARCRLESPLENPGERTGFIHADIVEYTKQHRRALVMAALSIPAQYIKAGKPDQHLSGWGGFEGWSNLIRSAIVWAGLPDPDTRIILADQADDESEILGSLFDAIEEMGETTVAEMIVATTPKLTALIGELHGNPNKLLGNLLRQHCGRVCGGRKLTKSGSMPAKWKLEIV